MQDGASNCQQRQIAEFLASVHLKPARKKKASPPHKKRNSHNTGLCLNSSYHADDHGGTCEIQEQREHKVRNISIFDRYRTAESTASVTSNEDCVRPALHKVAQGHLDANSIGNSPEHSPPSQPLQGQRAPYMVHQCIYNAAASSASAHTGPSEDDLSQAATSRTGVSMSQLVLNDDAHETVSGDEGVDPDNYTDVHDPLADELYDEYDDIVDMIDIVHVPSPTNGGGGARQNSRGVEWENLSPAAARAQVYITHHMMYVSLICICMCTLRD